MVEGEYCKGHFNIALNFLLLNIFSKVSIFSWLLNVRQKSHTVGINFTGQIILSNSIFKFDVPSAQFFLIVGGKCRAKKVNLQQTFPLRILVNTEVTLFCQNMSIYLPLSIKIQTKASFNSCLRDQHLVLETNQMNITCCFNAN